MNAQNIHFVVRTDKEIYVPNMSEIGEMQWPVLSNIVRILQTIALNKKTKEQAGAKRLNVARIQQALFEEGA